LFHRSFGDARSHLGLVFVEAIAHGFLSAAQVVGSRTSGVAQIADSRLPVYQITTGLIRVHRFALIDVSFQPTAKAIIFGFN
jgi:hypothetical protein